MTIFVPTNDAFRGFDGRKTENLIINHIGNIALSTQQFPEKLTSWVTGNPPLWVTKNRNGIFINQAKIIKENVGARSINGDQQVIIKNTINIK